MKKYNFNMDRNQRFGFRKYLGIGLCSVMIGSFFIAGGQQVKADTVGENNQNTTVVSSTSDNTSTDTTASTQDIEKPAPPASSVQDDTESNEQGTTVDATEAKTDRTTDEAQQAPAATENNGTGVNTQEVAESEQPAPVENKQETASESIETPDTPGADKSVETPEAAPTAKKEETTTFDIKNAEKSIDSKQLGESKVQVATRDNGGYDESTWGFLDVNNWSGEEHDGYYELTNYIGNIRHIIIPNEADFAKAGKIVSPVAISATLTRNWFTNNRTDSKPISIAISKTDGKTVKALGNDWSLGFSASSGNYSAKHSPLKNFDGNNLDVSGVTNFNNMFGDDELTNTDGVHDWQFSSRGITTIGMFRNNSISDLNGLKDWDTSHFTNISYMFTGNLLSDLTPLADWKVDNVNNLSNTFSNNTNTLEKLTGLENWNISKVTNLDEAFSGNSKLYDLSALSNWNVSSVLHMTGTFQFDNISNLSPLANWNVSHVHEFTNTFMNNKISDLTPLSGWHTDSASSMTGMFDNNLIADLTPLADWNTSSVTEMNNTFRNNKLTTLHGLEKWNTGHVIEMSGMFEHYNNNKQSEVGDLSDISAIKNWDVGNVTDFSSMFRHNKIIDLTPLKEWTVGSGNNFSSMFATNKIDDVKPISNWDMSQATNISFMLCENPLNTAVLTNWKLDKVQYAGEFIYILKNIKNNIPDYLKGKVVLVVNPKYVNKMSGDSSYSPNGELIPVVASNPNALTIDNNGDITQKDMPTVYGASSDDEAKAAIMDTINQKIKEYEDAHPGVTVTPDKDLGSLTLLELANAFFGVKTDPKTYETYYEFVDDEIKDDHGQPIPVGSAHNIKGKVNETIHFTVEIPDNYDLYELAKNQTLPTSYTFNADNNEPIIIHLVHKTNPIKEDKTIKRTITTIKPDGSSSDEVQSVTFTRTNTKDLVTQEITYGNWDADSRTFPSKNVEQIEGYDSYVDNIKSKVVNSQTVAPTDSNITVIVTYKAQGGNPGTPDNPPDVPPEPETPPKKDEPKDEKPDTPPTPPEVPDDQTPDKVEEPKKTKKHVKNPGQNGPIKGERNGIVNHTQNGPVKGEQYTGPIKGQLKETSTKIAATKQSDELPRTGEKQTIAAAILGLALAGLGLLGISINKKNKDNSN